MYFFECDACGAKHNFSHPVNYASSQFERACDACGKDGCVDCVSDAVCRTCDPSPVCEPGCLACLNGWSHG